MEASQDDLKSWDRAAMWQRLWTANPRLRMRTREFADRWYMLATTQPVADEPEARRLIRERERALKGMRSRLTYAEARDHRRGYPTSARLQFRWPQVQRMAADILDGLSGT